MYAAVVAAHEVMNAQEGAGGSGVPDTNVSLGNLMLDRAITST